MIRLFRPAVLSSAIVLVLLAVFTTAFANESVTDLIAQADWAYTTRHLQESMIEAIVLFEAVVPSLDTLSLETQAYVLNRLSQLCYEAPTLSEGDPSEDRALHEKGKAYGLQSLRLCSGFAEAEERDFDEAVSYVTDAAALLWTADNWGVLCGMNPIEGLLQQGKVLSLFSRSVDVDPTFWGGSASNALGSLLVMSPPALGGDKDAGLALLESAIATDPSYLPNRVVLAEYWGFTYNFLGQLTGVRDAELVERELAIVLDANIGDWSFWNRQAKQQAEKLLKQLHDMSP